MRTVLVQLPISKEQESIYAMRGKTPPKYEEVEGNLLGSEEVKMGNKYYIYSQGVSKYPRKVELGKVKVFKYALPIYVDMRYVKPYWGMKLSVYDKGDPSVGINGCQYNLELPYSPKDIGKEEREEIKKEFSKFVKETFDIVYGGESFDDECSDCGEKLFGYRCIDPRCYNSLWNEEPEGEKEIVRVSLVC